jgi:hypothetical protein
MREKISISKLAVWIAGAAIAAALAYVVVAAALHRWAFRNEPLGELEDALAIGAAAVVFGAVLWRLARGTWGREQSEGLLEIVDD